jgi:hypothetical protein
VLHTFGLPVALASGSSRVGRRAEMVSVADELPAAEVAGVAIDTAGQ